jgi:uncharacterized protein (TIGR03435 family)
MTLTKMLLSHAILISCAIVSLFAEAPSIDEQPPQFEIVSIRMHPPGDDGIHHEFRANGYFATNLSLLNLIQDAFGIQIDTLVSGLPSWARDMKLDIQAKFDADTMAAMQKAPSNVRIDLQKELLQGLLRDRFALLAKTEQHEEKVYVRLVLAHQSHRTTKQERTKIPAALKEDNQDPSSELVMIDGHKIIARRKDVNTSHPTFLCLRRTCS